MAAWGTDMLDIGEVANGLANMRPHWGARASGHLWRQWMQSDGENGEEPPQEIKDLWAAGDAFLEAAVTAPMNGWNWARNSIACPWAGFIKSARFSVRRSRCSSRPT